MTAVKTDTLPDYHTGQLRDVDDYNRRSTGRITEIHVGNDTLYVDADSSYVEGYSYEEQPYYEDNFYDNDYYYSSRMMRFHNYFPYDPWYWDFAYGWYDPWYDPWYGFYGRFYPYGWYSWSSWGWGWRHYPGWDLAWDSVVLIVLTEVLSSMADIVVEDEAIREVTPLVEEPVGAERMPAR